MSIDRINLGNPTEPARPFEKVLELSVVGDLAFVNICQLDDGNPTTTSTTLAQMTVSLPSLRDAVVLLCQDRDRENLRPKDERGEPMPDIEGTRYVVTPV